MELLYKELDLVSNLSELDIYLASEFFFEPSLDGTWFTILLTSKSLSQLCTVCLNENTLSSSCSNHLSSSLTSSLTAFILSLIPSSSLNKSSTWFSSWTVVEFLTEYNILSIVEIFLVSLEFLVRFFLSTPNIANWYCFPFSVILQLFKLETETAVSTPLCLNYTLWPPSANSLAIIVNDHQISVWSFVKVDTNCWATKIHPQLIGFTWIEASPWTTSPSNWSTASFSLPVELSSVLCLLLLTSFLPNWLTDLLL